MNVTDTLMQDLRFAVRQLRSNWIFAVTAIVVLALGMCASVAIFAFVEAALLKPLPYKDPSRLVGVYESIPLFERSNLSYFDYLDWKKMNTVFDSLDAYQSNGFILETPSSPELVRGARISDGFFKTLGIAPVMGRDFQDGEDLPAAPRTVLLSYATWQARFGGRADILGQSVVLNGDPNTVIGVLPPDFSFAPMGNIEFWVGLHASEGCSARRSCHNLYGVARLKPGATMQSALANVKAIAAQLEQQYPDSNRGQGAMVAPLQNVIVGDLRPILFLLLIGSALLLVIATVNVASLLLVRSESRKREIAVRTSLGAAPGRILAQFATEGFLLVAAAAAIGLPLVPATARILIHLIPADLLTRMPFWRHVGLTPGVLAFAAVIAVLSAVLFSLTPAIHLSFSERRSGLAEGSRGSAGNAWRRLGSKLVVVELATATVLLVGAGLLGKSLYRLLQVDLGFDPEHLVALNVAGMGPAYKTDVQNLAFARRVRDRVAKIPGVQSASVARLGIPLDGNGNTSWFRVLGRPWHGEHYETPQRNVTAEYFATLGAKLWRGRYFTEDEDASKPRSAIINRAFADKYFPGEEPLGKQLVFISTQGKPMEIVGIVENIKEGPIDVVTPPVLYLAFNQFPDNDFSLVVRGSQSSAALLNTLSSEIRKIDPSLVTYRGISMEQKIHDSQSAYLHRSSAWLVGGFAGLALLLGVIGLYGVIAYSVSQRTREIGIRMALGARQGLIYRMVLGESARLTAGGIVCGLLASLGAATMMRSLLFGVEGWDLATFGGVAAVLAVAALAAGFLPARRAAAVDPNSALRIE